MNPEHVYRSDDDDDVEDDDIHEELEDLRHACMVSGMPSDSDKEDDFEMLRSIKSQLSSSTDVLSCGTPPMGFSLPLVDSESEDDDLEMLRQLGLSIDEDDDGAFETLRAIRQEGVLLNDSSAKKKQVHALENEPSREILSRSNTCERFPDNHEQSGVTMPDPETSVEPLDQSLTCQSSLLPAASSRFPEAAQAFVEAIRINRSYQGFLRKKLGEIEATIMQNEKHQKNVMIVKDFCKKSTKHKDPRIELISTRKYGSSEGCDKKTSPLNFGPPENSSVANYRRALEKYPVSVYRRNWSAMERENLAKGLKMQVQDTLLKEAIERSSELEGSTTGDIDTILESIKNLEITPEMIRQFLPRVNWDQLDIKNRSSAECEARWLSCDDPLINKGPWTAAEDNRILLMTQNKSYIDWLDIAVSLGTNRNPLECLARYQRSLNPDILRREWTAEEDDQLRAAVAKFGEMDWQSVANVLQGRTGPQCSNRWKKSLKPKKGRWSSEENKRLTVAVTLFGTKNWEKIAKFVPGRMGVKCQERWENSLDPKIKHGKWTEEEDAEMNEAMAEHGHAWSIVAKHVSCRTDSQCRRRWEYLNPLEASLRRKARKLRRETTIGNFVDRESERPDLGVGNFLALTDISLEPEPALEKKKKRKAKEKKSDGAATERQPKRRRKGVERCSGDECRRENESVCENESNHGEEVRLLEWHKETEDNVVKEKKQRRKRKSVERGTSNESCVTTNCSKLEKLKPIRRKESAVVPMENQNVPN